MNALTEESKTTVAGVDARFFLIQPDGSIKTRNDSGKITEFCFRQKANALIHAKRKNARVFDKQQNAFVVIS